MVFRIPAERVPETFEAVWVREMSTGAYLPHWKTCQTDQGEVSALAFVINQTGPAYVPQPHEDELVEIVLRASGIYGPCVDYVMQTAIALKAAGICDERLAKLSDRLQARLQANQPDQ
jgi:cation transport protein ChaC